MSVFLPARLRLELHNDIAEVPRVLEAVDMFIAENSIPENGAFKLNLVLDELITNILTHGCQGRADCGAALSVEYGGGVIRVDLVDNGVPFNPIEAPVPGISASLEESHVGGLGVRLVRKYATSMSYSHAGGNNNFHFEMTAG